ncbi:hypothetical protein C8R44DRAFT_825199 [Mycena epipterygia]|nr:hypothetical protein C8R44DRAFT_825199 [Mycena epipterygia]
MSSIVTDTNPTLSEEPTPMATSQNANGNNGPGNSLQGWGSGINGGNANATTNSAGFPPPRGQEYAQNSTTAGQAYNNTPAEQNSAQPPIVPFKERVIGVAKKTRGTLLGKPELKEHGEKILQGEATIHGEPLETS